MRHRNPPTFCGLRLGLCLGAIFTAFRLDRPCRSPEKVRGRPGGPTLPRGRRTKSQSDAPLVSHLAGTMQKPRPWTGRGRRKYVSTFVQRVGTSGRSSDPQQTDARAARPYLSRKNSERARIRAGHRRRGSAHGGQAAAATMSCGGVAAVSLRAGSLTVASFSPLVRKLAHQIVSQLSPGRASVAASERAEYFASFRLSLAPRSKSTPPMQRRGRQRIPHHGRRGQVQAMAR